MSVISYYNGPQLTGEAITASRFCGIDPTASPDEMTMLVIIKCVALYNPIAGATLTATAAGEAKAAVSGDHVYAVALEPASGAGGYVRAQLVSSPIVVA